MKDTTAIFDEAASRSNKKSRYLLTFTKLAVTFSSFEDPAHPERWPLILEVSGAAGSVKPDEGKSDVSSITVKIVDDERFHQLLPALKRDSRATLRAGFAGLPESDWPALFTGLLDEPRLDDQMGTWTLTLNDLKFFTVNSAFRQFGKTKLNGAMAAGDNHAHVDSVDGSATGDVAFHDPAASETNGWILIDGKEICSYTTLVAGQIQGLIRGQLTVAGGYDAMAHNDNVTVQELFVLQGNPITLALKLLTSTGTGANGVYDVWEASQGLGIDEDLIDVSTFEMFRDTFLGGDVYRFVLKEPIKNVKSWLEDEIYKAINAYPRVTGDGLISMKLYHFPYAADPDTLTDDDVFELTKWERGFSNLINHAQFEYDWAPGPGQFLVQRYDISVESANDHGLSAPWKASFKGIYSDLQGESIINRRTVRLFNRYAEGAPGFSARAGLDKFKWDPGEIVEVTISRLIDAAKGARGVVGKLMETIRFAPDWHDGSIVMDLLDTSLGGRGAGIAPNGTPDYASATASQRNSAFICDTATQKMPNGDEPYLIV